MRTPIVSNADRKPAFGEECVLRVHAPRRLHGAGRQKKGRKEMAGRYEWTASFGGVFGGSHVDGKHTLVAALSLRSETCSYVVLGLAGECDRARYI
jgi:hypothetical protein